MAMATFSRQCLATVAASWHFCSASSHCAVVAVAEVAAVQQMLVASVI